MRLDRSTAAVSMPAARMPAALPQVNPCSCSMTSTRRVTSSGWGRGTTMNRSPVTANTSAMSSMFWASSRKSSSSTMVSANSSTRAGGLVRAAIGMRPTSMRGDPRHGGDVQPDQGGHGAPLDLDHHPLAGPQGGRVDLGDGGRGDGHPVEGDEHLGQGPSQVLLDGPAHGGEGLGRDPVPQQPELLDQLLGEDALARGDDLAELDVGRSQPLEGRPQPAGQTRSRRRGAPVRGGPSRAGPSPAGRPRRPPWPPKADAGE